MKWECVTSKEKTLHTGASALLPSIWMMKKSVAAVYLCPWQRDLPFAPVPNVIYLSTNMIVSLFNHLLQQQEKKDSFDSSICCESLTRPSDAGIKTERLWSELHSPFPPALWKLCVWGLEALGPGLEMGLELELRLIQFIQAPLAGMLLL